MNDRRRVSPHLPPFPLAEDSLIRFMPNQMGDYRLLRTVVIADENPAHHKATLNINNDGSRAGGCERCYNALVATYVNWGTHFRTLLATKRTEIEQERAAAGRSPLPEPKLAAQAKKRTMNALKPEIEAQENAHLAANAPAPTHPRGTLSGMSDVASLASEGMAWAEIYRPVRPLKKVINVQEVIDFLEEASDSGRHPINIVASLSHGTQDRVLLGGTIRRDLGRNTRSDPNEKKVSDFVDMIKDFVAPDIRWIFYACLTAGEDNEESGTYPDPDGVGTVVQRFHLELESSALKPEAEVWGHVGPGEATTRPYWRRFRTADLAADAATENVATLFNICFPEDYVNYWVSRPHLTANEIRGNMYIYFKQTLSRALQPDGIPDENNPRVPNTRKNAIVHIPMWPMDPEYTELPRFCQHAWERHPLSNRRR